MVNVTSMNVSPFTGQQQVYDWNSSWYEMSVSMPAMNHTNGELWVTFLSSLKGVACVFQFGSAFGAAYPEVGSKYWRLKTNTRRLSVSKDRVYSVQFEIREAF